MANVKISAKGWALLRNNYAAGQVVRAIVEASAVKLASSAGLSVNIGGKMLKVQTATPAKHKIE
jgi:hypothetical protein